MSFLNGGVLDDLFQIKTRDALLYEQERTRVLSALRLILPEADILEVGSTAVAGVIGKEDIDVLVRVKSPAFIKARTVLDVVFKRNPDQLSNAQYQGYLVNSSMDVAIQLTILGSFYDDFERFLDALRRDPQLLSRYNALKRAWDGKPMTEYRKAKRQFIESTLDIMK